MNSHESTGDLGGLGTLEDLKDEHDLDRTYGRSSHLGGFDFVARAAGPPGQVRQDLALLSVHARLHLAPPLLGYDGS